VWGGGVFRLVGRRGGGGGAACNDADKLSSQFVVKLPDITHVQKQYV
jgi:hypothetical protein